MIRIEPIAQLQRGSDSLRWERIDVLENGVHIVVTIFVEIRLSSRLIFPTIPHDPLSYHCPGKPGRREHVTHNVQKSQFNHVDKVSSCTLVAHARTPTSFS